METEVIPEYTRSPIKRLAEALLDSGNIMVISDGCSARSRDLVILMNIIGQNLMTFEISEIHEDKIHYTQVLRLKSDLDLNHKTFDSSRILVKEGI